MVGMKVGMKVVLLVVGKVASTADWWVDDWAVVLADWWVGDLVDQLVVQMAAL